MKRLWPWLLEAIGVLLFATGWTLIYVLLSALE